MASYSGFKFEVIDVFVPTPLTKFKGNQLGVVYVPQGAHVSKEEQLQISIEFNYSETIFIHMPTAGAEAETTEWTVDIFTTVTEIPFAGHPTIGASFAIQRLRKSDGPITIKLKAGPVSVSYIAINNLTPDTTKYLEAGGLDASSLKSWGDVRYAEASISHAFRVHSDVLSPQSLLKIQPKLEPFMGQGTLNTPSILASPSLGLSFCLIPMPSLESLAVVGLGAPSGPEAYVTRDEGFRESLIGCYHFYIESSDIVQGTDGPTKRIIVHTRMIEHALNVEDPATGSAACTLSMALALGLFDQGWAKENEASKLKTSSTDIRANEASRGKTTVVQITQGEQMGRKSVIYVRVFQNEAGRVEKVVLAGFGRAFAKGTLE